MQHLSPKLIPTLTHLPFTSDSPDHFVHIISNLLTEGECDELIRTHTNLVPSNVTRDTIREREMFQDADLAELLWHRLRGFYDGGEIADEDGCVWRARGLNERFRLCKYEKGKFHHLQQTLRSPNPKYGS
jgi:hypothetical protein